MEGIALNLLVVEMNQKCLQSWFNFGECLLIYDIMPQPNLAKLIKSGPLFTKMPPSYGYMDPHDEPKTVWRPSQVYNGNPYTDKTAYS